MTQSKRSARSWPLWLTVAAVSGLALTIDPGGQVGGSHLHTTIEVAATLLALVTGALCLSRYYSGGGAHLLYLGCAMAGAGVFDALHTALTCEMLVEHTASAPSRLTPWSWLAARFYLGILAVGAVLWWSLDGDDEGRRSDSARRIYGLSALLFVGCGVFFSLLPLPEAHQNATLGRPQELLAAIPMLAVLWIVARRRLWAEGALARWFTLGMIVFTAVQLLAMARSNALFDGAFMLGHGLKVVGTLAVLVGAMADGYEQYRRRREVERQLDYFFHAGPDLMCVSHGGRFIRLNRAWEEHLGYSVDEILATPPLELIHPDDREAALATGVLLAQGQEIRLHANRYRHRDGHYIWLQWAARLDPTTGYIHCAARDITAEKRMDELKSRFVSMVSHELRTPLTSIRGALGLIDGGAVGQIPEPAGQMVRIAAQNTDRLVRLINDILDIEKIESGKLSFQCQVQALSPVVRRSVAEMRGMADQAGVTLEVTEPLFDSVVDIDADRMVQVLTNLLSNAIKFSPANARVAIASQPHPSGVRVTVRDAGPGIPESFRQRVFDRFAQADNSASRAVGGSGLGLAIARSIVEHHGGHIDFVCEAGEGTCFWVDLPVVQGAALSPPLSASSAHPRPDGVRVLHVEDDPALSDVIRRELPTCEVDCAGTLAEARARLSEAAYDVVLLDLLLPDGRGEWLLDDLRDRPDTPPVIVFSVVDDHQRDVLDGRVYAVLTKARHDQAALARTVDAALSAVAGARSTAAATPAG